MLPPPRSTRRYRQNEASAQAQQAGAGADPGQQQESKTDDNVVNADYKVKDE